MKLFSIPIDKNRIYGLDILRALAITFVVVGHSILFFATNVFINRLFDFIIFDGVGIFFVLSGFLIGGILIRKFSAAKPTFKGLLSFWNRRWYRTLPNYFLILTVLIILAFFNQIYILPPHVEKFYLFIQNIDSLHPNFFNEAWSLSIEEWFYITIPLLLFLMNCVFKIKVKTALLFLAVTIILLVTCFRYHRFINFPALSTWGWDGFFRKQVVTRLDSIMFGVLGAYVAFYHKQLFLKYKKACFIVGIALFVFDKLFTLYFLNSHTLVYQYVFTFSIISIGTLLMLPYLSDLKHGKGIVFKAVTYASLISYSMYLINYSLVALFIVPKIASLFILFLNPLAAGLIESMLFFLFTIFGSILLYKFFEKPVMDLRNKG